MRRYVESFMKSVVAVAPGDSLGEVARLMDRHNVGAVFVVENHVPVGIVTDRDLALALGASGLPLDATATRAMTSPVESVQTGEGMFQATQVMRERNVRRLAVVDDEGLVVGVVTLDDLLRLLSRELTNLVESIAPEMLVRD
jgi:signal-transduction protein with cAMP-binding, CBS, and nucleotidyltransferase domain